MITKNNSKLTTSNHSLEEGMPSQIMAGHPLREGGNTIKWYDEIWEGFKSLSRLPSSYNPTIPVYAKRKTFNDCYLKYNLVTKGISSTISPVRNPNDNWYFFSATNDKIPILWELEAKIPNILYDSEGEKSNFRISFSEGPVRDVEDSVKLAKAIKEYLKEVPITHVAECVTGRWIDGHTVEHWNASSFPNTFRTYTESTGWKVRIASTNNEPNLFSGVILNCTFACTEIHDMTFSFEGNHIVNMDHLFAGVRNGNATQFNINVEYNNTEKPYPHLDIDTSNGFVPVNMIGTFRQSNPSQEALNNIFKNSILNYCRSIEKLFGYTLRTGGEKYLPAAYGCKDFEEKPQNILAPNFHDSKLEKRIGVHFFKQRNPEGYTIETGNLKESFAGSVITKVGFIIDCQYLHDRMLSNPFTNTFAYWAEGEAFRMKEIRLKNIGNFQNLYFDGRGGLGNDTIDFSKASIVYLLENLRDQTEYEGSDDDSLDLSHCLYDHCVLHVPNDWKITVGDKEFRTLAYKAKLKGWTIKINDLDPYE